LLRFKRSQQVEGKGDSSRSCAGKGESEGEGEVNRQGERDHEKKRARRRSHPIALKKQGKEPGGKKSIFSLGLEENQPGGELRRPKRGLRRY